MKNLVTKGIAVILLFASFPLLFSSCKSTEDVFTEYSKGLFDFTVSSDMISGTASITREGVVFDSTMRTPKVTLSGDFSYPLETKGIVKFSVKNTSNIQEITFGFITSVDGNWTNYKSVSLPIETSDKYKEYTLDLSGQYGWLYNLCGISLSSEGISSGAICVKSVKIEQGGANYPANFQIGSEDIIYTFKDRTAKGIGMAPDGIMGQWRNADGTINFIGSNLGKVFLSTGTEDDPFQKVLTYNSYPSDVDYGEFRYASIAQVVKDPNSDRLIGITHLERDLESKSYYVATIGLSVSTDGGLTWKFIGECITQTLPVTEAKTTSRDIANGTILVKDGYLYSFCIDMTTELKYGLSVSRVPLTELFSAVAENEVCTFKKYYNGQWDEPGMGGRFTNILPSDISPNFLYIQYNTVIGKYIMAICQAPYISQNDGDIALMISDDMTDWTNSKPYYVACSTRGEQYPTMISFDSSDPQTTSGDKFYLYYCSWNAYDQNGDTNWQLLWGTANYVRREITVSQ